MAEETTEVVTETTEENTDTVETTTETVSYVDGKYTSDKDLETGYKELQSSYSKKTAEYKEALGAFQGAPEDGYKLDEGLEVHPSMQEWAKENKFSNEALNDFAKMQSETQAKQIEEYKKGEITKLGENATDRIKNASDWAKANLGPEFADAINSQFVGAMSIEAIEKMMALTKGTAPADIKPNNEVTEDVIYKMQFEEKDAHGKRRYETDPDFRDKVNAMRGQL